MLLLICIRRDACRRTGSGGAGRCRHRRSAPEAVGCDSQRQRSSSSESTRHSAIDARQCAAYYTHLSRVRTLHIPTTAWPAATLCQSPSTCDDAGTRHMARGKTTQSQGTSRRCVRAGYQRMTCCHQAKAARLCWQCDVGVQFCCDAHLWCLAWHRGGTCVTWSVSTLAAVIAFGSVMASATRSSRRAVAEQRCLLLPGNRDGSREGVQGAVLGRSEAELHGLRSIPE